MTPFVFLPNRFIVAIAPRSTSEQELTQLEGRKQVAVVIITGRKVERSVLEHTKRISTFKILLVARLLKALGQVGSHTSLYVILAGLVSFALVRVEHPVLVGILTDDGHKPFDVFWRKFLRFAAQSLYLQL